MQLTTSHVSSSFTISTWVWMSADYPNDVMPIVCSLDATLCLYLKNRYDFLYSKMFPINSLPDKILCLWSDRIFVIRRNFALLTERVFFISYLNLNARFCRKVHGNLGSFVAEASEIIEPEEWHHLVYRYDAQSEYSSD